MRIAVTGASGLLGRHVATALLAAGHDVHGIDTASPPEGASWRHAAADVTDLGALAQLVDGCAAVVHIAAVPRPIGRAPADVFRINMAATYAAVEAAALVGATRFVYASSFSVYGYPFFANPVTPAYLPIDEAHPVGAQDVYALSKWLGEEVVEAAVRRGVFTAVSLRMPWIQTPATFHGAIGPRLQSGRAQDDLWAYLDARDAADAFVAAVTAPIEGHERLLLSADDTYADAPTDTLVREAYPGVRLTRPLPGCAALLDSSAASRVLGFTPRHGWRDGPKP